MAYVTGLVCVQASRSFWDRTIQKTATEEALFIVGMSWALRSGHVASGDFWSAQQVFWKALCFCFRGCIGARTAGPRTGKSTDKRIGPRSGLVVVAPSCCSSFIPRINGFSPGNAGNMRRTFTDWKLIHGLCRIPKEVAAQPFQVLGELESGGSESRRRLFKILALIRILLWRKRLVFAHGYESLGPKAISPKYVK